MLVKCILFHSFFIEQVAYGLQAEIGKEFCGLFVLEQGDECPCMRMQVLLLSITEQAFDDLLFADLVFDQGKDILAK